MKEIEEKDGGLCYGGVDFLRICRVFNRKWNKNLKIEGVPLCGGGWEGADFMTHLLTEIFIIFAT